MEHFSVDGTWWLVETPDRRVPGMLTFGDDGLSLVAHGSLPETTDDTSFPRWTETSVILGQAYDGRKITLLRAEGANSAHHLVAQTNYKVGLALVGCHTTHDSFDGAWFELDCLNAWVDPAPLTSDYTSPFSLRFDNVEMDRAVLGHSEIGLVAGVSGSVSPSRIRVDQDAAIKLSFPAMPYREPINSWVRPFMDLLIVCLGRAVRITHFQLLPTPSTPDDELKTLLLGNQYAEAFFPAVQAAPSHIPSAADLLTYTNPTLLTYRDSPVTFAELIPRWYELRDELKDVYVLLTGPYNAKFIFDEYRYGAVFQSAESFARSNRFSRREKSPQAHSDRVEAIINAAVAAGVDSEHVDWARRVLQARNDKPLWQLVHELVSSTGEVGRAILAARPGFASVVASLRAGVSHPSGRRRIDYRERYWLADALRWVVRAKTLIELGVPLSEIERRVRSRDGFIRMLDEIRGTSPES